MAFGTRTEAYERKLRNRYRREAVHFGEFVTKNLRAFHLAVEMNNPMASREYAAEASHYAELAGHFGRRV